MKSFVVKEKIKQYIKVTSGTVVMAAAVVNFFEPAGVVAGGVTGIAIILKSTLGLPMWIANGVINIPLFVAGYKILEKDIFIKTLYGTAALTVFLGVVPCAEVGTGNLLADIIAGGALMGGGLGLIFTAYASSGGTDLLATLINVRIKHISIPRILAAIDAVIVLAGALVFGVGKGIYAIIAIYIVTKVSDRIMEGPHRAKLIYIISDKSTEIGKYIVNNIGRGVTYINATGAYTNRSKNMIMCVVSAKEMVKIKQNIYRIDEKTICFVGDIGEAFGEGFTKYRG